MALTEQEIIDNYNEMNSICKICFDTTDDKFFGQLIALKCCHIFCTGCIRAYAQINNQPHINCPVCRSKHSVAWVMSEEAKF